MNPTVTITIPATTMRLSDSQQITLTLEASAPIHLAAPVPLLNDSSRLNWHISAIGTPMISEVKPGIERWQQVYRIEPFAAGTLPLEFLPFEVNDVVVQVPAQTITIQTAVEAETDLRPVTSALPVSASPQVTIDWLPDLFAIGLLLMVALLFRRRGSAPPLTPEEIARSAFQQLDSETDATRFADVLSKTMRTFLENRSQEPVTKQITTEITDPAVRALLTRCDGVKFAGQPLQESERRELLIEARRIAGV